MLRRWLALAVALGLLAALASGPAQAQQFYEGKTLRIVVGLAAGGGFDTYARTIARHLGKHIPGNPTIIVENMTGAGSLVSANHIFKVAKPDGLTMGHFNGSLLLGQVLGQKGIEFDGPKFGYVGAGREGRPGVRAGQGERHHERREVDGGEDAGEARRDRARVDPRQRRPDPEGGPRASDPGRVGLQGHRRHPAGRRERGAGRRLLVVGVDAGDLAGGADRGQRGRRPAGGAEAVPGPDRGAPGASASRRPTRGAG